MSVVNKTSHAPGTVFTNWETIPWSSVRKKVERLQMRIAKATREGTHRKANSLSWILTHSYYGKLLAVKRVTTNKGKKAAGVDGVIWRTSTQKLAAVKTLKRHGYKPLPLRRKYIPKRNGKKRPLGIPTMRDRAMQALYAMALKPIAETRADFNSYGFRDQRCCHDAIQQIYIALAKHNSARWIVEGDITSCFDRISHPWLLENIPMDKKILKAWLTAGYMEEGRLFPTTAGTPQGGIISPILANMTLDGLEQAIHNAVPRRSQVNVIRYADDFVTTGRTKELLEDEVMPAIKEFLEPRGLNLSEEKTLVTNIDEGFNFLGQTIRKYKGKFLIQPSKSAVKNLLGKVRDTIKTMRGAKPEWLITKLNPIIRGWVDYHKYVVSKKAFSYIDWRIERMLTQWAKRRHRNKGMRWIRQKYFYSPPGMGSTFSIRVEIEKGHSQLYSLFKASWQPIMRHVKVRQKANPFDPEYRKYFKGRKGRKGVLAWERQGAHRLRNAKVRSGVTGCPRPGDASEVLEPYDGKLSRTVLRGVRT